MTPECDIVEHRRKASQTLGAYCLPGPEMVALLDEIKQQELLLTSCYLLLKGKDDEIARLRDWVAEASEDNLRLRAALKAIADGDWGTDETRGTFARRTLEEKP